MIEVAALPCRLTARLLSPVALAKAAREISRSCVYDSDGSITATEADETVKELVVDLTPPSITVNSQISDDATPEITGTIDDPTASVSVVVGGTGYVGVNNGDGTWTLPDGAITVDLADDTYDVSVTSIDAVGNIGFDLSSDELVVDTTAPIITIDFLTTNDNRPQITGTINEATIAINVIIDSIAYSATNHGDGTWSIADDTILTPLADGTYTILATAFDLAGNPAFDSSFSELTIDTVAPVVSVNALVTNDTTPELTGLVDDVNASVNVNVDGIDYAATNNGNGTWNARK